MRLGVLKVMLIVLIFGVMVFVSCKKKSNPPEKPAIPSGPSSGSINVSYDFSSSSDDPDGDSIAIRFAWGDNNTSEWSSWVESGDSVSMVHSWSDSGSYYIKAQAKDINDVTSDWSGPHSIHIIRNQSPNIPSIPSGPASGNLNTSYNFSSSATDLDGDSVAIRFLWGDGDTSDWGSFVQSGQAVTMSHSWSLSDTYYIKSQAKDINGATTNWSESYSIIITPGGGNRPPNAPAIPSGPSTGRKDSLYGFTAITTDPDNDGVCYRFDWGDEDTSEWTAWVQSGWPGLAIHSWARADTYQVKAQAKDVNEVTSSWSGGRQIIISNPNPPNTPSTPSGPSFGYRDTSYYFSSSATDPDGDSVAIRFDWGYGNTSNWSSLVASGDSVSISHSWSDSGTYNIKAQAKDEDGAISSWSSPYSISILIISGWTFGGTSEDYGYSVQQTTDGGYVIAGSTSSFGAGESDVYLIKTDANGNSVWSKTFGGDSSDYGYSVQQTSDGGYIIAGYTESFGARYGDVYLIKTDGNGNLLWQKKFDGICIDYGRSVQQTSDGGYIIAGYGGYANGYYDVYLIKTDANGNSAWTKTFGRSDWDYGYSVQQTTDGGYIIAGSTYSYGAGSDVYLIKTDASGNQTWYKTYGGSNYDGGYSVQQTSDGGYIIAGYTGSFGAGNSDVYLIKTDANGNTMKTCLRAGTHRQTFSPNPNRNYPNRLLK